MSKTKLVFGKPLARVLTDKAESDLSAAKLLISHASINDEVFGFHLQQTVEKLAKAVLAWHKVEYPFTHDVAKLMDMLDKNRLTIPTRFDNLGRLTPFAEDLRYENAAVGTVAIDRQAAFDAVQEFAAWALGKMTK